MDKLKIACIALLAFFLFTRIAAADTYTDEATSLCSGIIPATSIFGNQVTRSSSFYR